MKTKLSALLVGAIALTGVSQIASAIEKSGQVKMYLLNPEGRADGLLLTDGTQIHFPPHLSSELVAEIKKSDRVKIDGSAEGDKVVRADTITNEKSGKTIRDMPPAPGEGPTLAPPPPPAGPNGPLAGAGAQVVPQPPRPPGLKEMTVNGTVSEQLYGPRSDVNGVVLSDGAIVHFGPRMLENTTVKISKGSKIKVSGFGTKNELGESIQATELSQQ